MEEEDAATLELQEPDGEPEGDRWALGADGRWEVQRSQGELAASAAEASAAALPPIDEAERVAMRQLSGEGDSKGPRSDAEGRLQLERL